MSRFTGFILICIAFFFSSCRGPSPEYYQEKGRMKTSELIRELQKIESLDELIHKGARLKVYYEELVDLIIESRSFQRRHHVTWDLDEEGHILSDELKFELMRLYKMPGAKQLMEKYQLPALVRLDAFEKKELKLRRP